MMNRIIGIPHPHPLPTKRVKLKQSNFMLQENFTNSVKKYVHVFIKKMYIRNTSLKM